jgi:hypothetical protein
MRLRNGRMKTQGGPVFVDRSIGIAQLKQRSAQGQPWFFRVRFNMQGLASLGENFQ